MISIRPIAIALSFLLLTYLMSLYLFNRPTAIHATDSATVRGPVFIESFNKRGALVEAGSMDASSDPYWWLDSGAQLRFAGGMGETIQGDLEQDDAWRTEY